MDEKKHLSFTGYSTYQTCPHKYDLHYNQKIRPDSQPAHLVFGSAVDVGITRLLITGGNINMALNEALTQLRRIYTENILLDERDFDGEILTDDLLESLSKRLRRHGWKGENPVALAESLFLRRTMDEKLSDNQMKCLEHLIYFSLLAKAKLMLEAFVEWIFPQIETIHSIQGNVKRGIFDFDITFKGIGRVIGDNKTASRPYEGDAIKWSTQLIGYGAERAMYIVFDKTIKKNRTKICSECGNNGTGKRHRTCDYLIDGVRCDGEWIETISPEVIPQIIVDDVPQSSRDMVEKAYADTEKLIEAGVFPRNLTNCQKQYGKPCPYIKLCWEGKMEGLVKHETK